MSRWSAASAPPARPRWPEGFAACPICERLTRIVVGLEPTRTRREALELQFRRYCEEREVRRIAEGEIAPEGLGRREARKLIAELRELERRYET